MVVYKRISKGDRKGRLGMNKGLLKNILMVILVIITIFSLFKYIDSLREKYDLLNALNQTKGQLVILEKEKQNLLQDLEKEKQLQEKLAQENLGLKDYLKASKKRLTRLFTDVGEAEKTIEQLNDQFSLLVVENAALREQKDKMTTQLTQVTQENDALKAKITSITEMKKAIKQLQRQMQRVDREIKKVKREDAAEGNRGFLTRDGKSTYWGRAKIEVVPLSPVGGSIPKE